MSPSCSKARTVLPTPYTYIAKIVPAAQKGMLKKTDARVQTVSESKYLIPFAHVRELSFSAMNVLRMVKCVTFLSLHPV